MSEPHEARAGPVRWAGSRSQATAAALIAIAAVVAARWLGPSDAFDQTQPRTMAYTTDMLVHGRLLLPLERGEHPATKPPLYNWCALPGVRLMGHASELAHKLPSLMALAGCCALLVILGRRLGDEVGLGWMSATAFACNHLVFKLGSLARPDMLLSLWLILGWVAATAALVRPDGEARARPPGLAVPLFWACVFLAGLTKGVAALPLPAYALAAGRVLRGSWRGAACLRWGLWLPLASSGFAGWLAAAYMIDPQHVIDRLWGAEIWGRVTGLGAGGADRGPWSLLTTLFNMPVYFVIRFAPWSVAAMAGMALLWRGGPEGGRGSEGRWGRGVPWIRAWMRGAALYVLVTAALYTLSAGKRADYIASTLGPGAILAAWWLRGAPHRARRLVVPATAVTVASLALYAQLDLSAPVRGFGDRIGAFIRVAARHIDADPRPVVFWNAGWSHLQSHLGQSSVDGRASVEAALRAGTPLWAVVGGAPEGIERRGRRLERMAAAEGRRARRVCASEVLPAWEGWPGQVALYAVEADAAPSGASSTPPGSASDNP